MGSRGQLPLDFDYLAREARVVASDVAIESHIDLTADALPGVDDLVEESKSEISEHCKGIEKWRTHVRLISVRVASVFKAKGVKQIKARDELVSTSRPVIRVYPYG